MYYNICTAVFSFLSYSKKIFNKRFCKTAVSVFSFLKIAILNTVLHFLLVSVQFVVFNFFF